MGQLLCDRLAMTTIFILFSFVFLAVSAVDIARQPKLFYVSTSATTSTLSTYSICYVSSKVALVSCSGRKEGTLTLIKLIQVFYMKLLHQKGHQVEMLQEKEMDDSSCIESQPPQFLHQHLTLQQ